MLTAMPRRSLFALLTLLGCTPSEPSSSGERQPAPAAPTNPASPTIEPDVPEPVAAVEPVTTRPASTPTPTPVYVATPGLRAVAMREGSIAISNGVVSIDGEALVIAGGRVERDARRSRGLEPMLPDEYPGHTLAFAGELSPGGLAAMTTTLEFGRGATQHKVYVYEGERWRRRVLERDAIIEYYPSLVERGGALLGMRAYALNPDMPGADDEENPELEAQFYAALGKAKPGFVQLAGAKTTLPSLPKQTYLAQAASSADGTLYAITAPRPKRAYDDETWPDPAWKPVLLVWPPDASEPKQLALPEHVPPDDVPEFTLSSAGDYALLGSVHAEGLPYLAVARGETIERVSAGIEVRANDANMVRSATRAPSGELWVVLGEPGEWSSASPEHELWKRDSGTQTWSRVFLPLLDDPRATTRQAATYYDHYRRRFIPVEYAASTAAPTAKTVAWLDGAAWIVADLGNLLEADTLLMSEVRRSVLYTTHAGSEPLVVLPTQDRMTFEQLAMADQGRAAVPGNEGCREFAFVVAAAVPSTPELAELERGALGLTSTQLDALAALAPIPFAEAATRAARIIAVYVGELPMRGEPSEPLPAREMIVMAEVGDASQVEPLREAVAKIVQVDVRAECRMRAPLRMLWSLPEDGD